MRRKNLSLQSKGGIRRYDNVYNNVDSDRLEG